MSEIKNDLIEDERSELLSWIAIFYGGLFELIELKEIKDTEGKTSDYLDRHPKAWYAAKIAIELWKKSDYGANEIEPDRFPETLTVDQLKYYNEVSAALKRDYEEKMWLLRQKIISDKDGG